MGEVKDNMGSNRGRAILYCKRCLMPNSRPRVTFDAAQVCNACRNSDEKEQINWSAREKEFRELSDRCRSRNGKWDCIVPWSGGKDSSAVAWRAKFDFGLNPLLVTFSPLLPTEAGEHNRECLIRAGFDHIYFRPNQDVHRNLARRFFIERGNLKVAWDAGVNVIPMLMAVQLNIPLVLYAEHGESEYGGKVLSEESKKIRDFTEVLEHQIGDDPRNWVDDEVSERDLIPYIYPSLEDIKRVGLRAYYTGYFLKWDMFQNYDFIKSKYDFHIHPKGRTVGTFTNFDSLDDKVDNLYYYLQFIKFGFGRAVRDASRMIQNKHLTREEGLELVRKYDGEFPEEYLPEVLDYLQMDRDELIKIIDSHRNEEIWKKDGKGWSLRYPPE